MTHTQTHTQSVTLLCLTDPPLRERTPPPGGNITAGGVINMYVCVCVSLYYFTEVVL